MATLCSIIWCTFGILLVDPAIIIPNAIGIIFSLVNIITLIILPKNKPEVEVEVGDKEKKEVEISVGGFDKNKDKDTEGKNDYKIPNPDLEKNEENNIGITERDQPAAYANAIAIDNAIAIEEKDNDRV